MRKRRRCCPSSVRNSAHASAAGEFSVGSLRALVAISTDQILLRTSMIDNLNLLLKCPG